MRKVLQKIASCFDEAGEIKFIREIAGERLPNWEQARTNLEVCLDKKYRPLKYQEKYE
jgi:hypothetical protein